MPSNLVSRIEKSNDTSRVFILNGQGNQILNKAITGVESNMITADGIDSSGNSILWLSYSSGLQNSYELVIDKFNVSDTVSNSVFYSTVANSFNQPLGIYSESQFVYLVLAVYQADSSSRLKWLKFDTYNGFAVDSFASTSQMNAIYNYAEIKNNRIIVNGSDIDGQKNWLFDIDAKTVVDWQWDFSGSTSWSNELIKFANNDMIFSVIHTSTDSTLNDANLILCDTNLNVQWTIKYNSEYNLNDSIVDVAFFSEKIYIAGFAETDTLNKDFVIVSLNIDGTLNWELKYDGPGVQAIDMGVSLSVDEVGDIYFTGQSIEGNQSNLFSVQLDEFGSVLWESDLAEAAQKRAVEIVTRDGNVYLSGQNLSTSINNFLILYKDSLKIESIQKLHMEMLASGLSLIQDDFQLKRLIWDKFSRQYSFRRTVSLSSMHKYLRSKGYDIYRLMNARINRDYKLDRNSKTVELILASLKGQKEIPFIHMPFFKDLQEIEFVEGRSTIFAYSSYWPPAIDDALPCFECDGLVTIVPCDDCPLIPDMLVVNLESGAMPHTNTDLFDCPPRNVIRCIRENSPAFSPGECDISCTFERSDNIGLVNSGNLYHYEIGIKLPTSFNTIESLQPIDCFATIQNIDEEEAYFSTQIVNSISHHRDPNPSDILSDVFTVKAVGTNKAFEIVDPVQGTFRSTCYPIRFGSYYGLNNSISGIENYWESISSITLCRDFNTFGIQNIGTSNWGMMLASGGIFELKPTFSSAPPIYFAQIWGDGIFYKVGPDYSINVDLLTGFGEHCVSGLNAGQVAIKSYLDRCVPCNSNFVQLFGDPLDLHIKRRIANYNFDVLNEFWQQSKIYIGVHSSTNSESYVDQNNFIELPNNNLPTCLSFSNPTLVCEFQSFPDGTFKFRSGGFNANIPTNEPVNIEVVALFEGGIEINTCFTHTFIDETSESLNGLTVLPTGRLREYIPNSGNYRIRIFKSN